MAKKYSMIFFIAFAFIIAFTGRASGDGKMALDGLFEEKIAGLFEAEGYKCHLIKAGSPLDRAAGELSVKRWVTKEMFSVKENNDGLVVIVFDQIIYLDEHPYYYEREVPAMINVCKKYGAAGVKFVLYSEGPDEGFENFVSRFKVNFPTCIATTRPGDEYGTSSDLYALVIAPGAQKILWCGPTYMHDIEIVLDVLLRSLRREKKPEPVAEAPEPPKTKEPVRPTFEASKPAQRSGRIPMEGTLSEDIASAFYDGVYDLHFVSPEDSAARYIEDIDAASWLNAKDPFRVSENSKKTIVLTLTRHQLGLTRAEIDNLKALQKKYDGRDIEFALLSTEKEEAVAPYVKDMGISFPVGAGASIPPERLRAGGGIVTYVIIPGVGKRIGWTGHASMAELDVVIERVLANFSGLD